MTRSHGKVRYNERTLSFDFAPYNKVYTCIRHIMPFLGLDYHDFHLVFNGKVVNPQDSYAKIGFTNGSMFDVSILKSIGIDPSNTPEPINTPIDDDEDIYEPTQDEIDALLQYGFELDLVKRMLQYTHGDLNSSIEKLADEFEPPPLKKRQSSDLITPSFLDSEWKDHLKNMIIGDTSYFYEILQEIGRSDGIVAQDILNDPRDFLEMIGINEKDNKEVFETILPSDENIDFAQENSNSDKREDSTVDNKANHDDEVELFKLLSDALENQENSMPAEKIESTDSINKPSKDGNELDYLLAELTEDEKILVFDLAHILDEPVEQVIQIFLVMDKDIEKTRSLITGS